MSTQTLIDRQGDQADVLGAQIKIPGDVSVLSMLGGKLNIYHGDDFTADPYWVVNTITGKRRKQLVRANSMEDCGSDEILVWAKVLDGDISEFEKRYFRMQEYSRLYFENVWKPMYEKLRKAGKAHVKARKSFTEYTDGETVVNDYWLYKASEHGVSFVWCPKPKKMLNPKLGAKYQKVSERSEVIGRRAYKFRSVFTRMLQNMYYKAVKEQDPYDRCRVMVFVINGREYVLETPGARYPTLLDSKKYKRVVIN